MPSHFVDNDPTIEVEYLDGVRKIVGLRELFLDAHLIRDVETRTHIGFAVWRRVLTAFAYRVTGLDESLGVDAWRARRSDVWTAGRFDPEAVTSYFDRWHHRFDLFGVERPWLQVGALREDSKSRHDPKSINEMVADRPTTDQDALHGSPFHYAAGDRNGLGPVEAAETLLTWLFAAPGGSGGAREGTTQHTIAGPFSKALIFLPLTGSLFSSLVASMTPPHPVLRNGDIDDCPWEREHEPRRDALTPYPSGNAPYLATPVSRAALLLPNEDGLVTHCLEGPQQVHRERIPGPVDPFLGYVTTKQYGQQVVDSKPTKSRADYFKTMFPDVSSANAPRFVDEIAHLPNMTTCRVAVVARFGNKSKIFADWRETTPEILFALWSETDDHSEAEAWRAGIGTWVRVLLRSADTFEFEMKRLSLTSRLPHGQEPKKGKKGTDELFLLAEPSYWADVYAAFDGALSDPETHALDFSANALENAAKAARKAALAAFDSVRDQQASSGQATVYAQARRRLSAFLSDGSLRKQVDADKANDEAVAAKTVTAA